VVHDVIMNFDDLLNVARPTTTVTIGGNELTLQALTADDLDEMITRYPPPAAKKKEQAFNDDLRFELVATTVTSIDLDTDQVRALFKAWSRSDVTKLQGACFRLNWIGVEDEKAPLSESESDETSDSL
jgi:dihydrofolate reductase